MSAHAFTEAIRRAGSQGFSFAVKAQPPAHAGRQTVRQAPTQRKPSEGVSIAGIRIG